jgi:hypothetical protein
LTILAAPEGQVALVVQGVQGCLVRHESLAFLAFLEGLRLQADLVDPGLLVVLAGQKGLAFRAARRDL